MTPDRKGIFSRHRSQVVAWLVGGLGLLGATLAYLRHTPAMPPEPLICPLPVTGGPHAGMVWIPPGVFALGDTLYPEEGPIRPVSVDGFWMDRTEVTNAQFAAFVAATGYVTVAERPVDTQRHPGLPLAMQQPGAVVFVMPTNLADGGDLRQWWQYRAGANWRHPGGPQTSITGRDAMPAVAITLQDAQAYARWLGHELPTEAQWEWAALGGTRSPMGQTEAPVQANTWQGVFPLSNLASDGFAGVAPVGCYPPNGYGLYDMIGNVWELTRDAYRPWHAGEHLGPDQERMAQRPQAAGSGSAASDAQLAVPLGQRVIKGGSYLCAPNYCMRYRAGARQAQDDDLATSHLGFRTVLRGP